MRKINPKYPDATLFISHASDMISTNQSMMKNIKILPFCLSILFLSSCEKEEQDMYMKIQTDKTQYSVSENISAEYTVIGSDSLYVSHCNYIIDSYLQKKEKHEWVNYASKLCLAIYISGQMVLPPGYVFSETAEIEDKGTYRIALNYVLVTDATEERCAYSDSFEVK
jgi:hypothetical protein